MEMVAETEMPKPEVEWVVAVVIRVVIAVRSPVPSAVAGPSRAGPGAGLRVASQRHIADASGIGRLDRGLRLGVDLCFIRRRGRGMDDGLRLA